MIIMQEVSSFIIDTLKTSQELEELCVVELGDKLFYLGEEDYSRLNEEIASYPFLDVSCYRKHSSSSMDMYTVSMCMAVKRKDSVKDKTQSIEYTLLSIGKVVNLIKELIEKELKIIGINGIMTIKISSWDEDNPMPNGEDGKRYDVTMTLEHKKCL